MTSLYAEKKTRKAEKKTCTANVAACGCIRKQQDFHSGRGAAGLGLGADGAREASSILGGESMSALSTCLWKLCRARSDVPAYLCSWTHAVIGHSKRLAAPPDQSLRRQAITFCLTCVGIHLLCTRLEPSMAEDMTLQIVGSDQN